MKTKLKALFIYGALLLLSDIAFAVSSAWKTADHIKARLVSETDSLTPSTAFYVGLELVPDEHWHVYWRNPGDSGMPVSLTWDLPQHISLKDFIWPIPERIPFGHLTNYGYESKVIFPVLLQSDPEFKGPATLKSKASWLVCKDTCIPGSAHFELPLVFGKKDIDNQVRTSLSPYINQKAKPLALMSGTISEADTTLAIQLFAKRPIFDQVQEIQFFPINESLFESGATTTIRWKNNFLSLSQEKSESFFKLPSTIEGLLVVDGKQAWEFSFITQP